MGVVVGFPGGVMFPVPGRNEDRVVYTTRVDGKCTEWCEEDPAKAVGWLEVAEEGGEDGLGLRPANDNEPPCHKEKQGCCGELEDFA